MGFSFHIFAILTAFTWENFQFNLNFSDATHELYYTFMETLLFTGWENLTIYCVLNNQPISSQIDLFWKDSDNCLE